MNAHSRTLTLPGAVRPTRERGASALDRVAISWPAPDPTTRVLDSWGAPTGLPVVRSGVAPWAPPDSVMRFDLPRPGTYGIFAPVGGSTRRTDLVEPRHDVSMPDIALASLAALAVPTVAAAGFAPPGLRSASVQAPAAQPLVAPPWPAPTVAIANSFGAPDPVATLDGSDRSGITLRLIVGLAAAAGAVAAGAAALISLF